MLARSRASFFTRTDALSLLERAHSSGAPRRSAKAGMRRGALPQFECKMWGETGVREPPRLQHLYFTRAFIDRATSSGVVEAELGEEACEPPHDSPKLSGSVVFSDAATCSVSSRSRKSPLAAPGEAPAPPGPNPVKEPGSSRPPVVGWFTPLRGCTPARISGSRPAPSKRPGATGSCAKSSPGRRRAKRGLPARIQRRPPRRFPGP